MTDDRQIESSGGVVLEGGATLAFWPDHVSAPQRDPGGAWSALVSYVGDTEGGRRSDPAA